MQTHRPKEDQNLWNFFFSVFFLVAVVGALWEVFGEYHDFPHSIPVFDMVLMSLAAFRITRLIVYDKIARWFRELFADTREFEDQGIWFVDVKPYGSGFRHTIYELLQCPWCIGFWSALIICFFYYMFPWAWFVILFLAVAGASSFIQIAANGIGWRAENLKMEAEEKKKEFPL